MARTLIKNGFVVTVNAARDVWREGYVAVDNGAVTSVGPKSATPPADGFDEIIDASNGVVMPGLINMHQHHWYTLFKGLADGLVLEDWVFSFLHPTAKNLTSHALRVSGYIAAMEMLSTGTTCFLNHSVTTTTQADISNSIEAPLELGIRQVFAKELRCRTRANPDHPFDLDEALSNFAEVHQRWEKYDSGLVRIAMAIECNAHWVASGMTTDQLITRGHELAKKLGLRISAHISGGSFSHPKGMLHHLRQTGRTDVQYLSQLGVLDRHWVLIHGIHVTDFDLERMAESGSSFVYTPTSESIRGGGIAPFSRAREAGINVALGTDGPMVDYSVDMVEQMKACTMMQHVRHLDPERMPAERSIEMATINAAKALGLDHEIGSIEIGKRADLAIFDLAKPHVGVVTRPISSLLFAAKGTDASTVLVDGKIVYRNGKFCRIADQRFSFDMANEGREICLEVLNKAGLEHRLAPDWRREPDTKSC